MIDNEIKSQIEKRTAGTRYDKIQSRIDKIHGDENPDTDKLEDLVIEKTTINILVELMECLNNGDDLAAAIETIQVNFA